jgi:hypothetical protein
MIDAGREIESAARPPHPPRKRSKLSKLSKLNKWLIWIGAVLLVLALAAGATVAILLRRAEPILRASLIDTLHQRFHSRVELDNLHVSVLDGFWVEGTGLRIWLPQEPDAKGQVSLYAQTHTEPWISVGKMHFHASWRIRPGEPIVVQVIHVEAVKVVLPPKEDRPPLSLSEKKPADSNATAAQTQQAIGGSASSGMFKLPHIVVQRIECNDAELGIERKQEPGKIKLPLEFELKKITLIPDGKGGPIAFTVDMVNAKPVGIIHTTGHFGPWVTGDTGAMPVEGSYTFDHADLGTIKGIEGILSSTGQYSGTLRHIEVNGQTQTPDFRLERVRKGTGVPLTTRFHAFVDATNGNTYLDRVEATLGHTHFVAKGQVVRADDAVPAPPSGTKGHDVALDVTMDQGRIEDILQIAADADKPFLTGNLTLQTKFHLPPGKESVLEKLVLDGQFHLSQTRFSSESMQGKIRQLSLRGQGKPDELKTTDPTSILSEMQGHFSLGSGTLQLPDLDYRVPGAELVAHGKYGLQAGTLDFVGDARLDASLSQVVGGWKGFLLKPVDGYLRKNGAGTDVPIHVQGTRKEPKFGVDLDRLGKNDPTEKTKLQ